MAAYYPACSTAPWQLDGVIRALKSAGYEGLTPVHNGTVVVDPREGAVNNKHESVTDRHELESVYLEDARWVDFEPKSPLLVLDKVYPNGFKIPEMLIGKNIVHLPTMKTHVFTTITGAMKNAFGGLLNYQRPLDALGNPRNARRPAEDSEGDSPRNLRRHGRDIRRRRPGAPRDALARQKRDPGQRGPGRHRRRIRSLMGFDPMSIGFIRLAHENGLGSGQIDEIEVVGEDIDEVNWRFRAAENTLASRGQKLIYWGPLKPLESLLLRSPLTPWAYTASNVYHNSYWLRFIGRKRVREAMKTEWGQLFQSY